MESCLRGHRKRVDPGQGDQAATGGVVEDEHPVFLLLREMVKEFVDDPRRDDYKTGAFLSVFSSLCNGFSVFKVLRKSNL